jgi:hypothetical protein
MFSPQLGKENKRIVSRCFQYFCTDAFAEFLKEPTRLEENSETAEGTQSYLEYPVLNWIEHGRVASLDIADAFNLKDEFFQQDSELRLIWFQTYWETCHNYEPEPYRFTLLHLAAYSGLLWLAAKLIGSSHEADLSMSDSSGWIPLHWAARNGHDAVVRLLLKHKADVDAKDNNGWTALYRAAREGHEAVVRLLIERKANIDVKTRKGRQR